MNEEQRQARKAQITEMMLALRVALETLEQLEAAIARKEEVEQVAAGPERNSVAHHVAAAISKARSRNNKS